MDAVLITLLTILSGFLIILVIFFIQTGGLNSILSSSLFSISKDANIYNHPTFLIIGATNSGKTTLFNKLQHEQDESDENNKEDVGGKITVSSIEPNRTFINFPLANASIGKKHQVIDYPGHLKLVKLLETLIIEKITLKNLEGIVYLIDSSSMNINDGVNFEKIVKFLYNLISITERIPNGVDYLIGINKTDLFDSVPVHKIKLKLELEINKLIRHEIDNIGKTSGIDDDDDVDSNNGQNDDGAGSGANNESLRAFWMGVVGNGDFTFDKLEGNVDFIAGSALKNTDSWENWMDERVVNP